MNELPDEIFSIIIPFIDRPYNFSITCKRFDALFVEYYCPSERQVVAAFMRGVPEPTLLQLIKKKKGSFSYLNLAIKHGYVGITKRFIKKNTYPTNVFIRTAIKYTKASARAEIVRLLLTDPNTIVDDSVLIEIAARDDLESAIPLMASFGKKLMYYAKKFNSNRIISINNQN